LLAQLRQLLASPTIASKHWIFQQYDGTVRGNTLLRQGDGDAGLIRVKGTAKAVAMKSDCNSRYAYLDPFWGGAHAVAEACRNLACVGAEPIGLTDCLNYGNPEKPENMWAFAQGILGIRQACLALEAPIVSGNVSLYNDTEGVGIFPTPMIGAVGLIEDCALADGEGNHFCGSAFQAEGQSIFVLGETRDELGGSEYLKQRTGRIFGPCPELRLDEELRLQAAVREGIRMGLIQSAHDTSEGGLLVAILESTFGRNLGCRLQLARAGLRLDGLLFGETAGRIVVSVAPEAEASLAKLAATHRVPLTRLGQTVADRTVVQVDGVTLIDLPKGILEEIYDSSLERSLA
jgi:phosphoribosylformylglycinamidine synthase